MILATSIRFYSAAAFLLSPGDRRAVDVRVRSRRPQTQDMITHHMHHKMDQRRSQLLRSSHLFSSRNAASAAPIREAIRYIAGRRALLLHPPPSDETNDNNANPPLVILGGMAQSIASWEFHLPYLSKHRSVLIYEALGQGPPPPEEVCSIDGRTVTLERYYQDVSLERQGNDFWNVIDEAFFAPGSHYHEHNNDDDDGSSNTITNAKIDVAGFSFGGRVAMAAASIQPNRIRRLHLSGVGADRGALASVILESWTEILGVSSSSDVEGENENEKDLLCDPYDHASRCTSRLRSFAWSVILATYSEQFLASAGKNRVKTWVDGVCRYNTEEGLRAILAQTHGSNVDKDNGKGDGQKDLWTPGEMAQRIQIQSSVENCRVVVGSLDAMSDPSQALKLVELLQQRTNDQGAAESSDDVSYKVVEGCGHAVPMEGMKLWREDVLAFLGGEQ